MKLRLLSTLLQQETESASWTQGKICALCFSADNRRLAVATGDRVISLYDENGVKVDKFTTKPNVTGLKDYLVRDIQFNSDISQPKLAVAQSDNIVFVYKWALVSHDVSSDGSSNAATIVDKSQNDTWSGKKTICNKFSEASSITCLVWPSRRPGEVVYGLEDGTVKLGVLRSNSSQTLHKSDHSVIAIAVKSDGGGAVTSHLDGSIYTITFIFGKEITGLVTLFSHHSCPAYAIAWGRSVCVAGNDAAVTFYDEKGQIEQRIEYSVVKEEKKGDRPYCKEFSCATCNISGDVMVLGNFDWFVIYIWDKHHRIWKENLITVVENMRNVTVIAWNPSGSQVVIGTSAGLLDLYSSFLYQCSYKNTFEIVSITPSYLTVHSVDDGASPSKTSALRSKNGVEITKLQFFTDFQKKTDRYAVARTTETLIVCDTENPDSISEIEWESNKGVEKFIFSCSNAFIICQFGEIIIIEYGENEMLASFCTEFVSEEVISLIIGDKTSITREIPSIKKVAYLLDAHTICAKNMLTSASAVFAHSHKIDFIELNYKADLLLFLDERQILYLVDLESQITSTLLTSCSYTQWVPKSDVVVSQSQNTMSVHYNMREPTVKSESEIKGEIEGIQCYADKTVVLINEGTMMRSHILCQELIDFGLAIEDKDLLVAVDMLDRMNEEPSSSRNIESLWRQLYDVCVEERHFKLAERCAAGLGNVSLVRYFHSLEKDVIRGKDAGISAQDNWRVKGKMFALTSQLAKAEEIYLAYGNIDDAFLMYERLSLFEEAIRLAKQVNHPDLESKKSAHMAWLLETNQEEVAALQKETEHDFVGAIRLYMSARQPGKACLVISRNNVVQPVSLLESVAFALEEAQMQGKAGEVFERIGSKQKALECYLSQHDYQKAMKLTRMYFSDQVVSLEEKWAHYLISVDRCEEAISHYIEAQLIVNALKVSIDIKSWTRAEDLIKSVTEAEAAPFLIQIAKHFDESKNLKQAEIYYVKAQKYDDMFLMYLEAGMFDKGHAVVKSCLSRSKLVAMYTKIASSKEQEGKLQDAENIYLAMNEPKWAISMHKKHRQFKRFIDLVTKFFPDQLEETHAYVGNQHKNAGDFKEAENHFILAGDSLQAVAMYREKKMFEDALRIGIKDFNESNCKQLAYEYATHLGFNTNAITTLSKLNVLNQAIEHAVEQFKFDDALRLAERCPPGKIQEIHLQYAMFLEDEDRFIEAEEEFLKAQRHMEAIDMYMHLRQWGDAVRIATRHEPKYVREVYTTQAQAYVDGKEYRKAEELFGRIGRPELALQMYKDANMAEDLLRLGESHLEPHVLETNISSQHDGVASGKKGTQVGSSLVASLLDSGECQTLWGKVGNGDLSENMVSSLVIDRVHALMLSKGWSEAKYALQAMLKYRGETKKVESIDLYHDLTRLILGMNSEAETRMDYSVLVMDLRSVLFNVVSNLRHPKQQTTAFKARLLADENERLESLLIAVHYVCMCTMCAEKGLYDICAKCAITLLRYDTLIPSDKRFYTAGHYCRKLKNETNLAFMLLNRYVDVIEAMEDGELNIVDSFDFAKATNVPVEKSVPGEHYLAHEKGREEVKDWVLSLCMEATVTKSLPADPKQAVGTLYEGLFNSKSDTGAIQPCCIITGYPIHDVSRIVKKETYVADKECLAAFVANFFGVDPWTLKNS